MEETLKLIVLADDPLARAGLAAMLATTPNIRVCDQGPSNLLSEAATGLLDPSAALVVWDVGRGRLESDPEEQLDGNIPVLALVGGEDAGRLAWQLGCRAIVARESDEEQLVAAIIAAGAGLVAFSPSLVAILLREKKTADFASTDLTPREVEVLALLAEGLTNKAIAHKLTISEHTVKFHVNAILSKLDAQSRTDAVVRATRLGLIAL